MHKSQTEQMLFRSKHHCWEKDTPLSLKTPLLGEGPIPFVENPTVERRTHLFRSKPHCWEKALPFRSNHTVGRRTTPFRWKPHCWEKVLPLSFKTPLLGEGPTPFVMFATFLHRLVSGVFEENIKIFKLAIVLLVGTLKKINFVCSIFRLKIVLFGDESELLNFLKILAMRKRLRKCFYYKKCVKAKML